MNPTPRWPGIFAGLTLTAVLVLALSGPLTRAGVLPWQLGLGGFAIAALVAGIGAIALLVAVLRRRAGKVTKIIMVLGFIGFAVPAFVVAKASGAPPIHDITTDFESPPMFSPTLREIRGSLSNPVGYDPEIIPLQKKAFPLVRPVTLALPPGEAFARAQDAARNMGWEIVTADALSLSIEATATSAWWGFKDDVIIRLTPVADGTRIDVRSKSRVGQGDMGANARRVILYLQMVARA